VYGVGLEHDVGRELCVFNVGVPAFEDDVPGRVVPVAFDKRSPDDLPPVDVARSEWWGELRVEWGTRLVFYALLKQIAVPST
jgi:hypothetical protein